MTLLGSRPSRAVTSARGTTAGAAAPARPVVPPVVAWLVAAAEVLVVAVSYRVAQDGGSPTLYYGVFWMGTLVMVASFVAVLLSSRASPRARTVAVLSLGVVTYVPKFLRNPYGPLYHDELAHSRAVEDLLLRRELHTPNPTITIIDEFPGLHLVTATLQGLTGLPPWAPASLLMLVAHIASLAAVLVLGRMLLPDPRAAGLAAVLYGLNPSYLYFDTQFAYESLGMVFFLWVLALTVAAVRTTSRTRALRLTAAVVLTLATVTTHHLTTLVLILVAAIACAAYALFARLEPSARGSWRPWGLVLATAAGGFTVWVLTVADATFAYLRPYFGRALSELAGQASGTQSGRTLYEGSVQPYYERLLGMAAPLVLLVALLLAAGATRLFSGWPARRSAIALGVFGLLYFASIPFILAPKGAEGARRSWGFTYVGLAVCVAGLLALWLWRHHRRRWAAVGVPIALAGLLIGNTGAGLNDPYRFPGPYQFGSDTRSLTVEVLALADEFGRRYPDQRIVSDRYTGLALAAHGRAFTASPSPGFRTYDLYLDAGEPAPFLVHELTSSHYTYLVVDERLSREFPSVGSYFEPDEPIPPDEDMDGLSPIPQEALDRFETVPWTTKVLATTNYSVYRLDFASVGTPQCDQPGCEVDAP